MLSGLQERALGVLDRFIVAMAHDDEWTMFVYGPSFRRMAEEIRWQRQALAQD